ncbi:MAG: MiaB/RimO family radical SAM methylthiotransferase, partial [Kiritimatiellae bacterium]|nr:MiaB/RimO family radical SAM methylthiotransferase [Kiritimatiellia bacterium]
MKFYIHTYGCQMNVRDSEAVESLMIAAGHEKAASEDDAEVVIINSCTVRQKAEEKAVGKSGNMIAAGKITGMMGCAVKRMGEDIFKRLPKLHFAVGPRAFGLIPRIVSEGRYPVLELGEDVVPVGMDAHVDTGWQSFVTVLLGCDNRCSYCIVPDVRGHEYSRPAKEVIAEVAALAKRGVKEVCLLGQSVLRYGIRNTAWDDAEGEAFPRLLRALNEIDGLERIRFTSAHPKGCTDELIRVYRECPKVCRHLHLPVQSGSDRV